MKRPSRVLPVFLRDYGGGNFHSCPLRAENAIWIVRGKHTEVEIQPGTRLPELGPSLVILSVGPRAADWSFSWDPCVEELSVKVPGAWVDERNEDFECLMGDRELCRFRRWEKYNKQIKMGNMVIKGIGKDNYKQNTRLPAPEWSERKDRERLQVRGMTTCEEFSPYKPPNWF
ncbi:hypothetical protein QL093DRAFT_2573377 [Fusarium oxysporum]|nr:hypothetical protein QL093DRAFT_2573377 [Fusarium oxysporum]